MKNEENNSGLGANSQVPEEIKGWNWAAFLLNFIWGLGNNVFYALLCGIPIFGIIMLFVLGAKGNEWAWRSKKWKSVEHFKRVQKIWLRVSLCLYALPIVVGSSLILLEKMEIIVPESAASLKKSASYQYSFRLISEDSRVIDMLGTPIRGSDFRIKGDLLKDASTGGETADLIYSVSGPKGEAEVIFFGSSFFNEWVIETLTIQMKNDSKKIELFNSKNGSNEFK